MNNVKTYTLTDNEELQLIVDAMGKNGGDYLIGDYIFNIKDIEVEGIMCRITIEGYDKDGKFSLNESPLVNGYFEDSKLDIQIATLLYLYKIGKLFKFVVN